MANYDTVRKGITALMKGLKYRESSQMIDFKDAPVNEYGNTFILKCLSGENQNDTIIDRFDDYQEWQLLIAFGKSEFNDRFEYDAMHRAKDIILKALDKPANWESYVKMQRYDTWNIIDTANYFILDIRLFIMDLYIHG